MEKDTNVKTDQTTKQKNGYDSEDEATSDSSRSTDDTSDNEAPKGVAGNRDSDKNDACEDQAVKPVRKSPYTEH